MCRCNHKTSGFELVFKICIATFIENCNANGFCIANFQNWNAIFPFRHINHNIKLKIDMLFFKIFAIQSNFALQSFKNALHFAICRPLFLNPGVLKHIKNGQRIRLTASAYLHDYDIREWWNMHYSLIHPSPDHLMCINFNKMGNLSQNTLQFVHK